MSKLASPLASGRKGSKSVRLMYSPRASSRRSRRDFDGKSAKSHRSELSAKPDSPQKISPMLLERPQLPEPFESTTYPNLDSRTHLRQPSQTSNKIHNFNNPESPPQRLDSKVPTIELNSGASSMIRNYQTYKRSSILDTERTVKATNQSNLIEESKGGSMMKAVNSMTQISPSFLS